MAIDSRKIDIDKVIELVESKINTEHFCCKLHSCNVDELYYEFAVWCKQCNFIFSYVYNPKEVRIRDMNKVLKRKNDKNGIIIEQLVANDIYQKFMSYWIGMAKCKKESKQENNKGE